jgi:adenylate cyclase
VTGEKGLAEQTVQVKLLGPFSVTSGGRTAGPWPRPSARRLCELVLVSPGRRVSRDLVCEELFPGRDPRTAARSVSKALSMARAALSGLGPHADSLLLADLTHIWASPAAQVDAEAQETALRAALSRAAGQDRDDRLVAALAEEAELLADEPYADWALRPRERLETRRQEARLTLARDRAKGAGRSRPEAVVRAWESCFAHDPASEEAAGALVRAYFGQGRRELAVRSYERCRTALEELGLRVSPSLEEVYAVAAPAASGRAPVAMREELRTVSVLFAEVAAPAGLARKLGLEGLRDVVAGSLAAVIAEMEELGGTVTSVSGGGLQALFGAPEAHEDDPERAVRAAFRAMAAVAGDQAPTLRIGVETGQALLGPIGGGTRVGYGAVGEVVAAAAALQSSARPGSALVGPATRAATSHLFTWGASERVQGTEPLVASYLGQPRATTTGRRLRSRIPLAGRQPELAVLSAALRAAVAGHGSLVVLTGEPGLGKTRLVQECRKRFMAWAGSANGRLPRWLEGRCASYASATPYGLYRQLVAGWVGVAADQPETALRPALERALVAATGKEDLFPLLARMMGLSPGAVPGRISPEELQRATFTALSSLISRLVTAGPTVLVLEDLHWADPTSIHLTLHLARLAADRPLLILATTRPDAGSELAGGELEGGELEGVERPGCPVHRILLKPLPHDAERELAQSLIGEAASAEVLDTVLTGVEGNPLFLEERLSSLLEAGGLVRSQDGWQVGAEADPGVPQVLERLVHSRVDRLSSAARDVVRTASVLGAEFPMSLLTAVCAPDESLEPAVTELCAADLVRQVAGRPDPAFRFRHALIQEATYGGLLQAERRRWHGRAAWALEAASPGRLEEVAAVLGRHFAAAGEAERALEYLELAGDHATAVFANDEAVSVFRAALAVMGEQHAGRQATAAGLHAKLANVLWRTGRRAAARDALQQALRNTGPEDARRRAHLLTRLGRLEMVDGHYAAATEAFDAAEALLGTNPMEEDDATVEAWLELMVDGRAGLHTQRNEPDLALATLRTVQPVLEARGTPARTYSFYQVIALGRVLRNRYRVDEADIADMRKAVAAAAQGGEEKDVGYATFFLGRLLLLRGDLAAAREQLEKSVALAERIGESLLLGQSLLALTVTALRRGDAPAVRSLAPRAMTAALAMASAPTETGVKACLAWLAWHDQRPEDVVTLAKEITGQRAAAGAFAVSYGWAYLWPLVAVYLKAGDIGEAVTTSRQLLDPEQQRPPQELESMLKDAHSAWDLGHREAASDKLKAALALARNLRYF